VRVTLEVGGVTETVSVEVGAEILQSQTANIATTIEVSQITNLPLVSRDPLNFVTMMPGVNTATINRNSTINGLPTSALDITLDGINIQDNFNKSTDGFFNRVPTSLDTVEEVTVSSSTNDAMSGAQGAAQIKFVSRSGSNEWRGSLYEYHRNPVLNSNYWFNNRDIAPDSSGKAPRARVLFNQYGGRVGGPIIRNRAFFFFNYEELRQPSSVNRQRIILSPLTQTGVFQYNTSNGVRTVDMLALAAANQQTSTVDPVVGKLLADIRSATSNTGGITTLTDPNQLRFSYSPTGISIVKRPTARFDVNVTEKHHASVSWAYYDGRGGPDFLNNVEPQFPGFPNYGQQPADRYVGSAALRSTLNSHLVNELRGGLSGGPSRFNPLASAKDFSGPLANQAGFNLTISAADAITNATATSAPSRRNPLIRDISDTLNWTHGAHTFSFGGKFDWLTLTYQAQTLVPTINFGVDTNDPANAMFTATNFPGSSTTDLTNAKGIYAVLTGRVTAINANVRLDEATGKYVYLGIGKERGRQKELGLFAQDSWRIRPTLTLNYGLRWEIQGSFYPMNSNYTTASIADLWGASGVGHLFSPGTLTGNTPQFVQFKSGTPSYDTQYSNFAPSFGFAWNPRPSSSLMRKLMGEQGTVIRGGYSIAYNRRGIGEWRGDISSNPGLTLTTNRDLTTGNLVGGSLGSLPLLLSQTSRLGPPAFSDTPTYPFVGPITSSVNVFDKHLKVPYAESWSFGIQRELGKDMAVEVRYVGSRFLQGWTTYNLNADENNIVENGLLNEFKLAQANLQANIAAGKATSGFAYTGAPGTSPLPIALAYFQGLAASQAGNPANYTSGNFTSSTFTTPLALNNPNICNSLNNGSSTSAGVCATASYANQLDTNATFRANALKAGLPANFMLTNPDLRGGANLLSNGAHNRYDGLQVDFHRRLSSGLLVGANYQFAKAFAAQRISLRTKWVNALDTSTLRHAFKLNWVYQMPFGSGKPLFSNAGGALNRVIGGWELEGVGRIQSGQLFDFGASAGGPVSLVGMTKKDLQNMYGLYFDNPNKIIYSLPPDVISNTIKAFNTSATSSTGYGSQGPPTGKYLAPGGSAGCTQVYAGQCAPQNVFVTGPRFSRFDLSLVKRVQIHERINFELRAEMLNAFNNINFQNPTGTAFTNPSSQTFGQITTAYQDLSNTNDPGGRLGQIVARINF
jgi:hypothetical protein